MRFSRYFALALALLSALYTMQAVAASATINGDDLQDCPVLLGQRKQAAYQSYMTQLKQQGDADSGLMFAEILHNRFTCMEQAVTGETGWSISQSTADGSVSTQNSPTLAHMKQYPEVLRALNQAVQALSQVAEEKVDARIFLGQYYAKYHEELGHADTGYFYLASAVATKCASRANKMQCQYLKQEKINYLGLLDQAARQRLDQQASVWARTYLARHKD